MINDEELNHYEKLLKVIINKTADIFTMYICDDMYSNDRAKKRNYLTEIELRIRFMIEDLIKNIKINNQEPNHE